MVSQLDSLNLAPDTLLASSSVQSPMTDEEELLLCYSLTLFGLTLFGKHEDAVTQLCQKLEECTHGRTKVQLLQPDAGEGKQAFALLRDHAYAIHVHGRYYGWLGTTDLPKLSPTLLEHLAHLCGMFFALYETSAFLHAPIDLAPAILEHTLTRRQRSIIALMAQGYDDQEIAQALSIAYATVRKHREAISS